MKKMNLRLYILLATTCACLSLNGQLYVQDFATNFAPFNTGNLPLPAYVSPAPNNTQLTQVRSSGTGMNISVSGGALQFARTGNAGTFTRSADFAPVPTALHVQMELEVLAAASTTTAARLHLGSAFVDDATGPANANVQSRFGINLVSGNQFSVRDLVVGANGTGTYSGVQTLTWVVNNTGATLTYVAPTGALATVANDTWDLWVGTVLEFNDRSAQTAAQTLTDLKFLFDSGTGTIRCHSLTVQPINTLQYRSLSSGNFNSPSTWQSSLDGTTWYNATLAPCFSAQGITVRNPHQILVTANTTVDQALVETGAKLTVENSVSLTLEATSPGLLVDGTLYVARLGIVSGNGDFELSSGATLGIAANNGLAFAIQALSKTFNSGAHYVFNGTTNQSTGLNAAVIGVPSTLTISNPTGVVTLDRNNLVLSGALLVTAGSRFYMGAAITNFTAGSIQNNGNIRNCVGATISPAPTATWTGTGGYNTFQISPVLAGGDQMLPYSQTIVQTSFVAPTWSIVSGTSLPAGLSLNAATGEISGTPTGSGDFFFVASASEGGCVGQQSFYLHIERDSTLTTWYDVLPKANANDGTAQDVFGTDVSIFGDYALVGAPGETVGANTAQGAAYIFHRTGNTWTQQAKLVANDGVANNFFGSAVSISGDYAFVSSPINNFTGAVYVFVRSGGTWTQTAKLTPSNAALLDYFGADVCVFGGYAVVGAYAKNNFTGSAYVYELRNGVWTEVSILTANDGLPDDRFGFSVSISETHALVGAERDDENGNGNQGSAYIFERTANGWIQQAKLLPSDSGPDQRFGFNVAISHDHALVGAIFSGTPILNNEGAAYLFTRNGNSWPQTQKFTASDAGPGHQFGRSVAISDEYIIIGASFAVNAGAPYSVGAAYVFEENGGIWAEQEKLVPYDGAQDDTYGHSVAMFGDFALVGSPWNDPGGNDAQGSAYFYRLADGCFDKSILTNSLAPATQSAAYSAPILVSGFSAPTFAVTGTNLLPAGLSLNPTTGVISGTPTGTGTFSFEVEVSDAVCTLSVTLTLAIAPDTTLNCWQDVLPVALASDFAVADRFGWDVAFSGDFALVGAPSDDRPGLGDAGAAYIFVKNGGSWTELQKLTAFDAQSGDEYGYSVDLHGDYAIVGTFGADIPGVLSGGSAYVYVRSGNTWVFQAKLLAPDGAAGDYFGYSVALSGNMAFVSARSAGGNVAFEGAVYVFERNGSNWVFQSKLDASDGASGDYFGISVSISGNRAAIGSGQHDVGPNNDQGAVYIFDRVGGVWQQSQKLIAADGGNGDYFGIDVALSGNELLAGASGADLPGNTDAGAIYAFSFVAGQWSQNAKLSSPSTRSMGYSVALSGDYGLGGAPLSAAPAMMQGLVLVYKKTGGTWAVQDTLRANNGGAFFLFGREVALTGRDALVGSADFNGTYTQQGAAYFYALENCCTAPAFSQCPSNVSVPNDLGQCGASVTYQSALTGTTPQTLTYAFSGGTNGAGQGNGSGSVFGLGSTGVLLTATNGCGTATCSFEVEVLDSEAPVLDCPEEINVSTDIGLCGAIVNFSATATDNCGDVAIAYNPEPGTVFPLGETNVTVTATDAAGLTSTCAFSVFVTDTESPSFTSCPSDITTDAAFNACTSIVTYSVSATDNCGAVSLSYSTPSGANFPIGTTVVTITATDDTGNSAVCSFNVTVEDTQAPSIVCPADISATNTLGSCARIINFNPTILDNCPGATGYTASPASGSSFAVGTTAVTITATDAAGNISTCGFDVTVTDSEPPSIVCPSNMTINALPGQCGAFPMYVATATDNCGVATIQYGTEPNTFFPVGTTTVTILATDIWGNTANCSFTVTVNDTQKPVIACPGNIIVAAVPGQCAAIVNYTAVATDNCGGALTPTYSIAPGSVFNMGTTTVTATATDPSGNTQSCAFTVTVIDTEPPVVFCPGDVIANTLGGLCYQVVNFTPVVQDNCPGATYVTNPASGSDFPVGTTPVTITATDFAGNTSVCTFNVIISDNQPPTIFCPSDLAETATNSYTLPDFTQGAFSFDNCGGTVTVLQSPAAGTIFNTSQNITVALVASDPLGNTATCSFDVALTISSCAIIYVDSAATGLNTGTSWPNAFTDVQSALAAAQPCDLIYVAKGTYLPTTNNDRSRSFNLRSDIQIYGGFPTGGSPFGQRDPMLYPSVLSGNIGNPVLANDNSYRVVQARNVGNNVLMDGFVITQAYSNVLAGGLYVLADSNGLSSPVFNNCVITHNYSKATGGGGQVQGLNGALASPVFNFCTIRNNQADANGAGLCVVSRYNGNTDVVFNNCTFNNNSTPTRGGALATWADAGSLSLELNACTMEGNTATVNGGAQYHFAKSPGTSYIEQNDGAFINNVSTNGGAIFYHPQGGSLTSAHNYCMFISNTASAAGGAVNAYAELAGGIGTNTFSGCTFQGNVALNGAVFSNNAVKSGQSHINTYRSLLYENNALERGGSMYINSSSAIANSLFENCVIRGSTALVAGAISFQTAAGSGFQRTAALTLHQVTIRGAGLARGGAITAMSSGNATSNVTMRNSIVWAFQQNPVSRTFQTSGVNSIVNVGFSDLPLSPAVNNELGNGTLVSVGGMIAADPLFLNPALGDLDLQGGSPCIDAGTAQGMPNVDYLGNVRPQGNGHDMGAYEFGGPRLMARTSEAENVEGIVATVFPNPSNGAFTLIFDRPLSGIAQVFDARGSLVNAQRFTQTGSIEFELGESLNGVYLLRIVSGEGVITKTLFLTR